MRKVFIFSITIPLLSCGKNDKIEQIDENKTIEDFIVDCRIEQITEKLNYILSQSLGSDSFNSERILSAIANNREIVHQLIAEYGEENILEFCDILTNESIDNPILKAGECCHRKPDGTIDDSCCGFWGYVTTSFVTAIRCSEPRPWEGTAAWEEYFDCIQERICKNC